MKKPVSVFIIILLLSFITLAAFYVLYFSGFPPYKISSARISGLNANVEIIYSQEDITHIYAENNHDLFLSLGYIHAASNLYEMDMLIKISQGKLSEMFGEKYSIHDQQIKNLGFYQKAKDDFSKLDTNLQSILIAYTNGINSFIKSKKYLYRFKKSGYEPSDWQAMDCIAIFRLMDWLVSFPEKQKTVNDQLSIIYSREKIQEGFITEIINDSTTLNPDMLSFQNKQFALYETLTKLLGISLPLLKDKVFCIRENTKDSYPLFCVENSMTLFNKSIYTKVGLNSCDISAFGLTIPGIPVFFGGWNNNILWNYSLSCEKSRQFTNREQWAKRQSVQQTDTLLTTQDTAKIKDTDFYSSKTEATTTFSTNNSDLNCPDIVEYLKVFSKNPPKNTNLHDLNNVIEIKPDTQDNLSAKVASPVILLNKNQLNSLIMELEYSQMSDYLSLNPQTNMQKITNYYSKQYSAIARTILSIVLQSINLKEDSDAIEHQCLTLLKNWDYSITNKSIETTIFNYILLEIINQTYKDEMDLAGPLVLHQFLSSGERALNNIIFLMLLGESSWFDDIKTPSKTETRANIICRAFNIAIGKLKEQYSDNLIEWEWERVYQSIIEKETEVNPLLKRICIESGKNSLTIFSMGEEKICELRASGDALIYETNRLDLLSKHEKQVFLSPAQ